MKRRELAGISQILQEGKLYIRFVVVWSLLNAREGEIDIHTVQDSSSLDGKKKSSFRKPSFLRPPSASSPHPWGSEARKKERAEEQLQGFFFPVCIQSVGACVCVKLPSFIVESGSERRKGERARGLFARERARAEEGAFLPLPPPPPPSLPPFPLVTPFPSSLQWRGPIYRGGVGGGKGLSLVPQGTQGNAGTAHANKTGQREGERRGGGGKGCGLQEQTGRRDFSDWPERRGGGKRRYQ